MWKKLTAFAIRISSQPKKVFFANENKKKKKSIKRKVMQISSLGIIYLNIFEDN